MTNEIVTTNNTEVANYVNTVEADAAGKKVIANAINNAVSLAEFESAILKIANIITASGVRKGRNGAPDVVCQNTYLIDTDGNAYFTQSDGVARSINGIIALYPEFPRDTENGEFAEMSLISKQLPNGNTIKSIKLV